MRRARRAIFLNEVMDLVVKSCRNIIDGTFRAMMRDARKYGIGEKDIFADLTWPRLQHQSPIRSMKSARPSLPTSKRNGRFTTRLSANSLEPAPGQAK